MNMFKRRFDEEPTIAGDIVVCKHWEREGTYFRMLNTDICGMSIIKQLCEKGEIKAEEVLNLPHGNVRTKTKDIKLAVNGRWIS